MTRTKRPAGLTAQIVGAVAIVDAHWLHSGLTVTEWAALFMALVGVVSYFNPLPK